MCCLVLVACAVRSHVGESYNIARMLDTNPPINDCAFTITCDDTTNYCTERGFWAHINDKDKRMDFCNKFFASADVGVGIVATTDTTGACISLPKTFNLRGAQWTRSAVIVHEWTHTNYVMGSLGATKDYAYGFNANWLLPRKLFERSCAKYARAGKIFCPAAANPKEPLKESLCPADKAVNNADTYSFIAAGVYFSHWWGKVQDPALPKVSLTKRARSRVSRNPRSVLPRRESLSRR